MMVFFGTGQWVRKYLLSRNKTTVEHGLGAVEGSLLGLLALILSFTFSISSNRYDKRMAVIVEEANDIGTAVLRADLYPDSLRTALRTEFRKYVEFRIAFYEAGRDLKKINTIMDSTVQSQNRLWKMVTDGSRDKESLIRSNQMIPALNTMIDVTTTRNALLIAKVPDLILFLLFTLCLTGSFLLGYNSKGRSDYIIMGCFFIMISLTIYMILDLDRPRSGIITLSDMNNFITSLRSMFNER
jgi:hypothetical protein